MADWNKLESRGKVEDRRATSGGKILGGGIGGVVLLMGITYLMGGDPLQVLLQTDPSVFTQVVAPTEDVKQFEGVDSYETFASTVLGSNNEYWQKIFKEEKEVYVEPKLILFRGQTESDCGGAASTVGPHYCPSDNNIYLDETFFEELATRFGANGGDVAQSYVIGHEVGHHVQNLLGLLEADASSETSIKIELQADCFAGLWEGSLKEQGILTPGEIDEAITAVAAVGDDNVQKKTQGQVQPESWTHGSSKDRVASFTKGYKSKDWQVCLES